MCSKGPTRPLLVSLEVKLVSYVGQTTLNIELPGGNLSHLSFPFETFSIDFLY